MISPWLFLLIRSIKIGSCKLTRCLVRGRHPSLPMDKPYLHNAHTFLIAHLTLSKATPLEDIAYEHRQALVQALEPSNINQSLAVTREMCHQGYPIHICEPFQVSHNITNWCRAWHGIDFSKVATNSEKATAATTEIPSSPTPLILGHGLERDLPHRCKSRYNSRAALMDIRT
jgi:hypothetical protein